MQIWRSDRLLAVELRWSVGRIPVSNVASNMNTTSESLLVRLRNVHEIDGTPDHEAWRAFVRIYTPWLFHWSKTVGLNHADAADLVQDVLTIFYRKLPEFHYDRRRSFRAWLKTVTMNRYRDLMRKKSNRFATATESMLADHASRHRIESTWDLHHARFLVAAAMKPMQADFQNETWKALQLVMSGSASVDEAAERTGVSTWTIYSARARLMRRLREQLEGLM